MSGFMQAEMTDKQAWYSVDGPMGTEFIPADVCGGGDISTEVREDGYREVPDFLRDYCENTKVYNRPDAIERIIGYGVRSTAPGYLDCTEWAVYGTKKEAIRAAREEQAACDGEDF